MSKWPMVRLGDVCEVNPRTNVENLDIEVSFVPMSCISENGTLELLETRSFTEVKNGFTTFQDRDVIFAKITPCMENGKGAIVDRLCNGVGAGSTEFHVIRPDQSKVLSEWIFLFTKWDHFREEAKLNMTGSAGQKRVPKKFLLEHLLPLPPLETQKKIADVLDKAKSLIDLRKKQIEKMDLLIKSKFIEMFGDPVTNPKGWPTKELKDITSKIGSGATPRGGKESYIKYGICLIRSMNVHNGKFKYEELAHIDESQAKQLENVTVFENDLLINITGASVARSCVVPKTTLPARVNQHVSIIRCNPKVISYQYMNKLLINESYQKKLLSIGGAGGATREAITKRQLELLEIPLPPLDLQNQFACFVELVEKQKKLFEQALDKMEINYKSLMQEYFG